MSAQEVIERIKALPPHERQEVVDYVRESEAAAVVKEEQPDWDKVFDKVFAEHDELFRKLAQ
jgi:hypothetical protein